MSEDTDCKSSSFRGREIHTKAAYCFCVFNKYCDHSSLRKAWSIMIYNTWKPYHMDYIYIIQLENHYNTCFSASPSRIRFQPSLPTNFRFFTLTYRKHLLKHSLIKTNGILTYQKIEHHYQFIFQVINQFLYILYKRIRWDKSRILHLNKKWPALTQHTDLNE